MINLLNTGKRIFIHQLTDAEGKIITYRIEPNETKEVPDEIAKFWLRAPEIRKVGASGDKDAEIERLKKELAKAKAVNKSVDKKEEKADNSDIDALRTRAKELKIKGYATIKTAEKLSAKIAEAEAKLNDNAQVDIEDVIAE